MVQLARKIKLFFTHAVNILVTLVANDATPEASRKSEPTHGQKDYAGKHLGGVECDPESKGNTFL